MKEGFNSKSSIFGRKEYPTLSGFEAVYLEDSCILGIREKNGKVVFSLELVLTLQHPLYQPPQPQERYCYRRAHLIFPELKKTIWEKKPLRPSEDATGSIDYGNIDSFYQEGQSYHLSGDWGEVQILSGPPYFREPAENGALNDDY